jgi:hypothetical protein
MPTEVGEAKEGTHGSVAVGGLKTPSLVLDCFSATAFCSASLFGVENRGGAWLPALVSCGGGQEARAGDAVGTDKALVEYATNDVGASLELCILHPQPVIIVSYLARNCAIYPGHFMQ